MKKIFAILKIGSLVFFSTLAGEPARSTPASSTIAPTTKAEEKDEGVVQFTPPSGWRLADSTLLPPHVRVMVVGTGNPFFLPL
jgi:hypothetical protein